MSTEDLRRSLISRARAGDRNALEMLLSGFPLELPKATIRAWRDMEIRTAYRALRAEDPQRTENFCVEAIAEAGGSLMSNRSPLADLSKAERAELRDRIDEVVRISGKWLKTSQIRAIAVSTFDPIATENEDEA